MDKPRIASETRTTAETSIEISLNLDGVGNGVIDTGIPFFDHMLTLFAHHGIFDLQVVAKGDLDVDYHHLVEDTGIVLGNVLRKALGDKSGIERYGSFLLPMDECLSRFVIDLSGRPYLAYEVVCSQTFVRDFNIQLVREFFQAFANHAGANVHISLLAGDEPHHVAESIFKGFGRALLQAVRFDPRRKGSIPSTKGKLA